jgi:chromosome segregation ATPase
MQSILTISWFPTAALICGVVFGVLTLSGACLMIFKEQRSSGISILLAVLGTLLLVVSIWQSRSSNISELQAKIAEIEQQNRQLAKELEKTSGQQRTQGTTFSDANTQLQTSLSTLQKDESQRKHQIEALNRTQIQIYQSLAEVKQEIDKQSSQIQKLDDKQQQASTSIQDQLKNISDSHSTQLTAHEHLLDKIINQITQLKTAFTSISADHSEQLENLNEQRKTLVQQIDGIAHQHQADLKLLQEDAEAASSQSQELNLVKASTQRELSILRRDIKQLQANIQQLQGRRHRPQ